MRVEGRLPYQPPGWLTPVWVAKGAASVSAAQVTILLVEQATMAWLARAALVMFSQLFAIGTVHLATRRSPWRSDAMTGMFRWVPLSGAVGAVLLVVGAAVIAGRPADVLEDVAFCVLAAFGGFLAGFFLSFFALPLALVADCGQSRPNHEAPVRALIGGGVWLLGVAGLCLAIDGSTPVEMLAPGAGVLALGAIWTALRARFVRRVRAGRLPGFVIVESEGGAVASGLLPYRPLRGPCIVDTLAAVTPDTAGVYRGVVPPVPLCLLQRVGGRAPVTAKC